MPQGGGLEVAAQGGVVVAHLPVVSFLGTRGGLNQVRAWLIVLV